jgi:hypothetical protein
MASLPPPPIMHSAATTTQMSTPINQLPLKTTQVESDTSDMDDPLIQGVLKEFEDEIAASQPPRQLHEHTQQVLQPVQHIQPVQQPQQMIQQQPQYYAQPTELQYNKDSKKLFDADIARKAAIITAVIYLFTNGFKIVMGRIPETWSSYTNGRELIINLALCFITFYVVLYMDII